MRLNSDARSGEPAPAVDRSAHGRYRWYVLAVLTIAQGCHALDRSVIGLVLESVKREFGLTDGESGVLAGLSYGIAFGIAAIPFGLAVDRTNRRNLLAAALSVWSGFTVVCGFVNSYWALLLARSAVGAAEAGGSPTGISLISDYFRPSERASAVGYWYMSAGIGTFVAFLVGGVIAQNYGWRAVFIAFGLPGLVIALVLLLTVREPVRGAMDERLPEAPPASALSFGARARLIAGTPGLVHIMAALVIIAIASSGISAWLAALLIRVHGFSLLQAGVIVAFSLGFASSFGGGVTGYVVDRLHRARGFSAARSATISGIIPLISAVFAAGAFLVSSPLATVVLLIALGFFISAYNGPANGLVITIADKRVRGLSIATVQFGANLVGFAMGPVIVGTISQALGGETALRWGMVAMLVFYIWGSAHLLLSARALRRQSANASFD